MNLEARRPVKTLAEESKQEKTRPKWREGGHGERRREEEVNYIYWTPSGLVRPDTLWRPRQVGCGEWERGAQQGCCVSGLRNRADGSAMGGGQEYRRSGGGKGGWWVQFWKCWDWGAGGISSSSSTRMKILWQFQSLSSAEQKMSIIAFAKTPISSGNWCVKRASMAVKEHNPAVKRMKKGSSFFG